MKTLNDLVKASIKNLAENCECFKGKPCSTHWCDKNMESLAKDWEKARQEITKGKKMKTFKVGDRVLDKSVKLRGTIVYLFKAGENSLVDWDNAEEYVAELCHLTKLNSKKKSVLRYKYMLLNLGDVPMETPGYYKDEQEVKAQYRIADKVERLTDTVRKFKE